MLGEAIESLSERERTILTLLHVHHLQGAEIDEEYGLRVTEVLSSVARAA